MTQAQQITGLLAVLGFKKKEFDRDRVAWRHPVTGTEISEDQVTRLRTYDDVVMAIHRHGVGVGAENVRGPIRDSLGLRYVR